MIVDTFDLDSGKLLMRLKGTPQEVADCIAVMQANSFGGMFLGTMGSEDDGHDEEPKP
jgi:hypothetical protein